MQYALGILPLLVLANVALSQTATNDKYKQRRLELSSGASITQLTQNFESSLGKLNANIEKAESLKDLSLDDPTQVWSQNWQTVSAESAEATKDLEVLRNSVKQSLLALEPNGRSPARNILANLESTLTSLIKTRSQAFIYNPTLGISLSPLDSARYTAGSLRLDRMKDLYEDQLDKIEFPDTDSLDPAVVDADDWIESIRQTDPGLMTTGHLYDAYCIQSILETYPTSHRPVPRSNFDAVMRASSPSTGWPPPRKNPMRKLSGICDLQKFQLQSRRDSNPWLQLPPLQGESSLDLGPGKNVDCAKLSLDFQSYIRGYEESSVLIQKMIALLDDYASNRLNDDQFHKAYDPLEKSYNDLQDSLTKLYPDENFERTHALRVSWKTGEKPSADARFVPWLVDYGPNSWNGSWQSLLTQQDWHLAGPSFTSTQGIQYTVKASIHDICVDHRGVRIFGFWADSKCSSGSCLFLQPGLSLEAGG